MSQNTYLTNKIIAKKILKVIDVSLDSYMLGHINLFHTVVLILQFDDAFMATLQAQVWLHQKLWFNPNFRLRLVLFPWFPILPLNELGLARY